MLARIQSGAICGVDVKPVEVEVRITSRKTGSVPGGNSPLIEKFTLVGLPDAAIRESRERVFSSLGDMGFFQQNFHQPESLNVTVSLAPADLRKSGAFYDLPIALGMLSARGKFPPSSMENTLVAGELGLDGSVRGVRGALAFAILARQQHIPTLVVPLENAREASAVRDIRVIGVRSLQEALLHFSGTVPLSPCVWQENAEMSENFWQGIPDYLDVKGQEAAKRALTVAAAGNHNLLMIGPPGTGKSMLAKRLPGILPPLSREESMEATKIHSIAGTLPAHSGLMRRRPYRDPHHTVSDAGLIGGQQIPRPGELSLAHCGVLFLDELPEFRRNTLEVLRQPLENGKVTIARASGSYEFPSRIMLIAAMNPCPCGYYGSRIRQCRCSPFAIASYRSRLSGPLLDRLDLHLEIPEISEELLTSRRNGESSASMREKVLRARKIQEERYRGTGILDNAGLQGKWLDRFCALSPVTRTQMKQIIQALALSARAYDRILRVARTIADLNGGNDIAPEDISEAVQYRLLDRANAFQP